MSGIHRILVPFTFWLTLSSTSFGQSPKDVQQYALLVGCSEYRETIFPVLKGAVNGVRMWNKLLTDPIPAGFAFPAAQVTQLVGWPDRPELRPTYANIVKGFQRLFEKAEVNDRIMIVLCGHGIQFQLLDREDQSHQKNLESRLVEIFLPADYRMRIGRQQDRNYLSRREIVEWLDKIRGKGAHVFIVFDCCCAGKMARSLDETTSSVNPLHENWGTLVAFYGAQSDERAIELSLPLEIDFEKREKHGLLSFSLVQALQQRKMSLTYRELSQIMMAKFREIPYDPKPLPSAEGDLDREVFGSIRVSEPIRGLSLPRNEKQNHSPSRRAHCLD